MSRASATPQASRACSISVVHVAPPLRRWVSSQGSKPLAVRAAYSRFASGAPSLWAKEMNSLRRRGPCMVLVNLPHFADTRVEHPA